MKIICLKNIIFNGQSYLTGNNADVEKAVAESLIERGLAAVVECGEELNSKTEIAEEVTEIAETETAEEIAEQPKEKPHRGRPAKK